MQMLLSKKIYRGYHERKQPSRGVGWAESLSASRYHENRCKAKLPDVIHGSSAIATCYTTFFLTTGGSELLRAYIRCYCGRIN